MPRLARRTRPCCRIWVSTCWAVLEATEKQMPCAPMMTAVLTPITSARELTSGPPELPGFSAASVWMTSPIRRPFWARSERPTALTMPAVTVDSKPNGLPMATATCPGRTFLELPRRAAGSRSLVSARSTAMSVSGSRPRMRAGTWRPSFSDRSIAVAPSTTWLLVSTRPSGERIVPEPEPCAPWRVPRTRTCTTDGETASTTLTTACE